MYGLSILVRDIEFMLRRKIGLHWKICWGIIVPVGLSLILIMNMKDAGSGQLERAYPPVAIACGWFLTTVGLSILPMATLHAIWTRKGEGIEAVKSYLY